MGFGHFPQNSATESNPEGWQRVAGGRSGQMVNDHRKGVACPSTPERGARRCEYRMTLLPLKLPLEEGLRPYRNKWNPWPKRAGAMPLGNANLDHAWLRRVWHPSRGAGPFPRRCPEVAAPKTPGDLRLPSGNPPGWLPENVQTPGPRALTRRTVGVSIGV
jgi:hypothetical protein